MPGNRTSLPRSSATLRTRRSSSIVRETHSLSRLSRKTTVTSRHRCEPPCTPSRRRPTAPSETSRRPSDTSAERRTVSETPPTAQPAWLGSFRNQAGLFASTGYASLALARNGHDRAVPSTFTRLTAAADGLPEARARAAISCDAKLGALHLAHPSGDPAVGVARARHVLAGMRTVRSVRVLRDARHLRTALAGHPRDAEAKHLGHELDQLLDQVI